MLVNRSVPFIPCRFFGYQRRITAAVFVAETRSANFLRLKYRKASHHATSNYAHDTTSSEPACITFRDHVLLSRFIHLVNIPAGCWWNENRSQQISDSDYFKDIIEQERRIGTIVLAVGGVLMAISLLCCCYGTGLYARNQARNAPSSNAFPTTTMTSTITIPAHQYNPSSSPNPRVKYHSVDPGSWVIPTNTGCFDRGPESIFWPKWPSPSFTSTRDYCYPMEPRSTMMTDPVNSTRVDLDLPSYDEAWWWNIPS